MVYWSPLVKQLGGKPIEEDEIREEHEAYRRRRNFLIDVGREQSRHFDKYILTLAAGTFGLSLLFVERIAPHPKDGTEWLLIAAWVAFGASILSTLISILLTQEASLKQIKMLDEQYKKHDLKEGKTRNVFTTCTRILNWASMFFFITGVIFLIIFAASNLLS